MDNELSIIVPVYNCHKFLERTVNALLTQNVSTYEILLVDDGSTDASSILCDKLSSKHPNVRCFHIENSGPGFARNFGIERANAKYIAFCDSDDIPHPNMYGILLDTLKAQSVDLVLCDIYTERDGRAFGFPWKSNIRFEGETLVSNIIASMLGNLSDNDATQPVWGSSVRCMYRRDIILDNNIRFPQDIRFAEDLVFNIRYLSNINSCYILNEVLYRYTFNQESLMNSYGDYNPTTFEQRIRLVRYINRIISHLSENAELTQRFETSQRCYYVECIGNAARAIKKHGLRQAYLETRSIVNHPDVIKAFSRYDAQSLKKRLSYGMIRNKMSLLLLCYFFIRLRKI